jgi:hypothetical protein
VCVCVWERHHALATLLPGKSHRIQRIGGLTRRLAGMGSAKKTKNLIHAGIESGFRRYPIYGLFTMLTDISRIFSIL